MRTLVSRGALALLLSCIVLLSGCMSMYVDGNLPEVPSSQFTKPAAPKPVQMVWEFQSKGASNSRATEYLKPKIREQVVASGLFADVTEAPAPGGALLVLTVNNIPLTDDVAVKGFVTGLTFGLAGNVVRDGYECNLRFIPGGAGATSVNKQVKHVIYTTAGSADAPAGAVKMANGAEAATTMVRQAVSRLLSELSKDPGFN